MVNLSSTGNMATIPHPVVTDVTMRVFTSSLSCSVPEPDPRVWYRIEKDLNLHRSWQSAWIYVALMDVKDLGAEDVVITDIRVGQQPPDSKEGQPWEGRPGGIWILRSKLSGRIDNVVTAVDVLFGEDAVDPRPQWTLTDSPVLTDMRTDILPARLTVLHGRVAPEFAFGDSLRAREDGRFKIVQISDTHMVTGAGVCKDAIDAHGNNLPESEADPLTVQFIGTILDAEKPDLVILTGDQLHHDIPDSQSALFKVTAPIIERHIPFAAVFGNHDSEGEYALPRQVQMAILGDLPYSLCSSGPEEVDGVGNFFIHILGPAPSKVPLSTLYFLDSHGQKPSLLHNPDYEPISQNQIAWFRNTTEAHRNAREKFDHERNLYLSLAFLHIPIPEFGDSGLQIYSGHRREPTEGPSFNSHFYDALVEAGVSALGCGHDHVNDFCALLPHENRKGNDQNHSGPWLCYSGGVGFGGYCSYGKDRFHRRARIWDLDTRVGGLKTWKRVEYTSDRVDEILLIENRKKTNLV